ncbi:helix-turn-helix transcriptional regulator [Marinicella litoralis]|uniref:Transcriptional regulator n=1 Tax=Marinicella litoralis TaxID=644220 RepID=A0A4R6XME0_9GAMM|nr:metalloregulator ArsR/SmtB family transcription factor [Marinicella litoralis]TDR18463.1 transcriptional regulator [Marinicella litoralis]
MKTEEKIIHLLKVNGSMTAQDLARETNVTTMGVRQHMLKFEDQGEVVYTDKKVARGRPTRYWSLTEKSHSRFPDGHESLTLKLIESVKQVFGEQGLDELIKQREKESYDAYSLVLGQHNNLLDKLQALAQLRSEEGYMANIKQQDGDYWLLENHCSICAAASQCLKFCRSELHLFESLLVNQASISREEHIMEGARRCAYKITPLV